MMATLANYKTLKPWVSDHMSPRRKLRYFRFAVERAARVALAAGTITAGNLTTILGVTKRPWRKNTTYGTTIDVLKWVAYDMATSRGADVADWYVQLSWLAAADQMATLLAAISTRTVTVPST